MCTYIMFIVKKMAVVDCYGVLSFDRHRRNLLPYVKTVRREVNADFSLEGQKYECWGVQIS